jgi:hypothetical protein
VGPFLFRDPDYRERDPNDPALKQNAAQMPLHLRQALRGTATGCPWGENAWYLDFQGSKAPDRVLVTVPQAGRCSVNVLINPVILFI